MRLRYCLSSKPNDDDAAWFDTDAGRRLTDDEVTARIGTTETWTVRYDDGSQRDYVATFAENGWLSPSDVSILERYASSGKYTGCVSPRQSAEALIRDMATSDILRRDVSIVSIKSSDGYAADVATVRFVSDGIATDTRYWFVSDDVACAREVFGARCSDGISMFIYGGGSLRHVRYVSSHSGSQRDSAAQVRSDASDRRLASSASFRAELAVLRQFRSLFPLPRYVWTRAAEETGIAVEIKVNDGPWLEVDGKGVPIPRKNDDA